MFVNPIWQDEVQRIGKQRCTPTGYLLHTISDMIGFVAIILLLTVVCCLIYSGFRGTFTWSQLWFLIIPVATAVVGSLVHAWSWNLADRLDFKYDYETRTATWRTPAGTLQSFTYEDWRADNTVPSRSTDLT